MSHYILSFAIGSSQNYSSVYSSLIDQVKKVSEKHEWDETTSFIAFESSLSTIQLGAKLFLETEINSVHDKFVLINTSTHEYYAIGHKYPALLKGALGMTQVNP